MKSGLLGILKNVYDLESVLNCVYFANRLFYLFNEKQIGFKFKNMFKGISTGHATNISINYNKI